jgi:hypothetical protein
MRLLRVCLLLVIAAIPLVGHAENKNVAREAYREGSRLYEVGEYRSALEAFKKAYLNFEDPSFLFNMAQCSRQLGDKAEALRVYRLFLRKTPNGANTEAVRKIVADLQAAIDQEKTATSRPPIGTMGPGAPSSAPQESATAPPPATSPPTHEAAPAASPSESAPVQVVGSTPSEQPAKTPVYKKWWLWTTVGVVVVGAGLGIGLGLGLSHGSSFNPTQGSFGPGAAIIFK